ncbi:MAG TPA: hypothetical protein VND19_15335 [Acetobacteraceae bacterium]|nr:hypothetical protein [Acetobacteraceae bacterium]
MLGQRTRVLASIAAVDSYPVADGVSLRVIADSFEADGALLQRRVVKIGDAGLDGVIESLEP